MSSVHSNIEALERAILQEADGEAQQVLSEAQDEADHIRQDFRARSEREVGPIIQKAQRKAERSHSHLIATAQLEAQNLKLQRRESLLEQAFDKARERAASLTHQAGYRQVVHRLVVEAIGHIGSDEVTIRADEHTRNLFDNQFVAELEQELGAQIHIGEPLKRNTGVVVETRDGHRRIDNTLETRLERMRGELRAPVYHILMGEKA